VACITQPSTGDSRCCRRGNKSEVGLKTLEEQMFELVDAAQSENLHGKQALQCKV